MYQQRNGQPPWRVGTCALAVLFALVVVERPDSQNAPAAPSGLTDLFGPGGALQDTNGDDVTDFVAARILVAPQASASDVAAAANIAARFGFETMAMNLPITRRGEGATADRLAVLVGRQQPDVSRLVTSGAVTLTGLAADEGMVAFVPAADSGMGSDAIVVAGADDAGTLAAATALAARAPYLWALDGATFEQLEQDLRAFLEKAGAAPGSVTVTTASVAQDVQEWRTVTVRAGFGATDRANAARTALERLAQAHSAGREGETLSYPGVATLQGRLAAGSSAPGRVAIGRVGPRAAAPAPRRAGGGGNRSVDLSNLYATGGLLGDSQNDLIPERTDTVIIPAGGGEA
ncbi:MAG TPA: hypothetical protein VGD94_24805, partial [Vicinamibacterales bacterium]